MGKHRLRKNPPPQPQPPGHAAVAPSVNPPRTDFLETLLTAWYHNVKRDLPWRKTRDPYAILVSELMLQQTQVSTVIPFYHKFLQAFPTVEALATADLQQVLRLWAGLGYYRRAKHLHAAAQAIVQAHHGRVPSTVQELLTLPGVGRYTAGAVASIAFGQSAPILDGNVMRVLSRITNLKHDISLPGTNKHLWQLAEAQTPAQNPGDYNQALMELGATVCLPRNPQCPLCPIRKLCQAFAHGTQNSVPIKKRRTTVKAVRRSAFVLSHRNRILLLQRPKDVVWEHLWEFPSFDLTQFNFRGQISDELQEQLGLVITLDRWQGRLVHQLTHRTFTYRVFRGRVVQRSAAVRLPECDTGIYADYRWVPRQQLDTLPVARITHKLAALALSGGQS